MSLLDQNIPELEETLAALGEPKFRAKQLYAWLAAGAAFEEMTNLPKSLREKLRAAQQEGYVEPIEVLKAEDGTRKYLFRLADGNTVESVLMRKNYGNTLCLSTQVGCRMGCAFCASCKNGLIRNLTPGEMLAQFIFANRELGGGRSIKNIVLMGMGEPFDNYDHVAAFLRRVNDANGLGVSWRDISLSTCGLVPQILRFAQENMPVHLCLSLHAPTDEKRRKIMPAAKKWKLEEIISALKCYFEKTGRRIIIEYAIIPGFNDGQEDASALRALLAGLNCHINLIPLNKVPECSFAPPTKHQVYAFANMLKRQGLSATVRHSAGQEILGACGQLRNRTLENS